MILAPTATQGRLSDMATLKIKNYLHYFDWVSFILTLLLCGIGLLFVFSATYTPEQPFSIFAKKQIGGLIGGLAVYWLVALTDHRALMRWGYVGYFLVIGLLIFTLIKGSIGMGAQRWINLVFIKVQPSELAKALFPAFAAYHFFQCSDKKNNSRSYTLWEKFGPVLVVMGISFLLIAKQPDLGTALVLVFSGFFLLWLAGLPNKFFLYGALVCGLATPILWQGLKPYQKKRIAVFLGEGESRKERYQIEQATIAIGSGGMIGKGFLQGTQNKLRFLPEGRTDFIFAVVCEEFGFFGAVLLLCIYAFLYARLFFLISSITQLHMQLLAIGILIQIMISTLINIGMVLGLLPIVGIPLPLLSYGLSNLWVTLGSLGWLQGIIMQEFYLSGYGLKPMRRS